jgi:hypothetical protein
MPKVYGLKLYQGSLDVNEVLKLMLAQIDSQN